MLLTEVLTTVIYITSVETTQTTNLSKHSRNTLQISLFLIQIGTWKRNEDRTRNPKKRENFLFITLNKLNNLTSMSWSRFNKIKGCYRPTLRGWSLFLTKQGFCDIRLRPTEVRLKFPFVTQSTHPMYF